MFLAFMPFTTAQAKVDWEVSSAVQLDEIPIDVAQTQGGDLTFLLTDAAKVVIYSAAGKVVGTIPVDPSVTDIAVSAKGEQLYLINSKRKTLQTVDINFIVEINVGDSPFLGPARAKVVLAVFSDFQ
jgi:DNA-binding beta-propeller fold protein YncE